MLACVLAIDMDAALKSRILLGGRVFAGPVPIEAGVRRRPERLDILLLNLGPDEVYGPGIRSAGPR